MHKLLDRSVPTAIAVNREALSVDMAALILGVGKVTVYRLLKEGRLIRLKIGRRTLISASDLSAFVARLSDKVG